MTWLNRISVFESGTSVCSSLAQAPRLFDPKVCGSPPPFVESAAQRAPPRSEAP